MKDISFEKALKDLEETVTKLEESKVSLDESLALFEKGVKLAKYLRGELDKAEKKIEILIEDEKGEIQAKPFELTKKPEVDPAESDDMGDENNSLF